MNWTDVAAANPYLTALVLIIAISAGSRTVFLCCNRAMRALNIRKNGWPPPHCDADGDLLDLHKRDV